MQVAEHSQPSPLVVDSIALVAGQDLVSAVAGEHDLDVLARQARHEIRRDGGGVGERLVEAGQQLVEDLQVAGLHQELVVRRPAPLRDLAGVGKLVVAILAEPDREGLDLASRPPSP